MKKAYVKPKRPCSHRRQYLRSIGQWPSTELRVRKEKHLAHNKLQGQLAIERRTSKLADMGVAVESGGV